MFFRKMRNRNRIEAQQWFSELDNETQQETAIKYLRSLDNTSFKNLLTAVDSYRDGDKILKNKVKDPTPEPEDDSSAD